MNETDQLAVKAAADVAYLELLVKRNEFFILKCASSSVHRYITKSDDEWAIALHAFSLAVKDYTPERGRFLSFCEMVIRRKMIDYLRTQSKYHEEISVSPTVFDSPPEEEEDDVVLRTEVSQKIAVITDDSIRLEIDAVSKTLTEYGFSFFDLTGNSPKADKTKTACAKAVAYLVKNPILLNNMRESKLLPIKQVSNESGVPRKILERHRKYIIAAAEIITGDYPCLADYMLYIRKELER
ncbi:sigma factor [Faecalispora anaeroviscerum]|uniref:sigma factor n=1 Tax=Faecalispora anaeroviscerum TaxID=2991836 RepID=UPI0024BA54AB|nr:sigma factor [Faecalispora anaeroviscerum]